MNGLCSGVLSNFASITLQLLNINPFGLIYARAQKNLDPSGVTVAIMRDDFIEMCQSKELPSYLRYPIRASTYNTVSISDVEPLAAFMEEFVKKNG